MTTTDPDQGITLQVGTDPANYPPAQNSMFAGILSRLNLRYANEATRTANHPVSAENEVSALAAEDRVDIYDAANWISLRRRANFSSVFRTADATPVNNSTVLVPDAVMTTAVPTAGSFFWYDNIFYDSSQAGDFKVAYTWPAGATVKWGAVQGVAVGATGTTFDTQAGVVTASGTALPFGGAAVGTLTLVTIFGYIVMGGTSGNLVLQYAQNTADPTNTTVRSGTAREMWRVS